MKKDQEFKKKLIAYAKSDCVPKPDQERRAETIHNVIDTIQMDSVRTNSYEFVRGQLPFIQKKTWLCQILSLLALYYLALNHNLQYIPNHSYITAAIAAPVLLLFMMEDIVKVVRPGMVELEATTIHTVSLVLVSRFLILGIADVLMLLGFLSVTALASGKELLRFVVYSMVPFLLTSTGILFLMNHYSGDRLRYGTTAISLFMIACVLMTGRQQIIPIYDTEYVKGWVYLGAILLIVLVYEFRKLVSRDQDSVQDA